MKINGYHRHLKWLASLGYTHEQIADTVNCDNGRDLPDFALWGVAIRLPDERVEAANAAIANRLRNCK